MFSLYSNSLIVVHDISTILHSHYPRHQCRMVPLMILHIDDIDINLMIYKVTISSSNACQLTSSVKCHLRGNLLGTVVEYNDSYYVLCVSLQPL